MMQSLVNTGPLVLGFEVRGRPAGTPSPGLELTRSDILLLLRTFWHVGFNFIVLIDILLSRIIVLHLLVAQLSIFCPQYLHTSVFVAY